MTKLKVMVAAHGHCFDGLASAAMFTHLKQTIDPRPLSFRYRSCGYGPNMQTVPQRWLTGDENAIVDFRYSESERLTWYFDHHVTAFASEAQREAALDPDNARAKRYFFDPSYGSCTKLIADVGRQRFGVRFEAFDDLIRWADKIDRAAFESAADAVSRSHPVKQLACVVEQHGDAPLYTQLVPELLAHPVELVAESEAVQSLWQPIRAAIASTEERIRAGLELRGRVAVVDLHDAPLRSSGKFVAYALAPECVYSVALIRMKQHFKISIGYNPWGPSERDHDIGRICQRFGGGGHPVVGAVSIPLGKLDDARAIVEQVIEELNA